MSPATESPSADKLIGRVLADRFEIASVLGEGGMGKVYSAKDRESDSLAAVKVVHGKLSDNEEYVQRLKQEARTAGRLRHDNAVRILAHGETEQGEAFLAMEYCPGRSLKEVIAKEKHLAVPRACNIIAQVLGAVGAAHKQGIIHRDIKPENIKIAPDPLRGEGVKVLDFGVAKFIGGEGAPEMENAVKTKTGIILGTPKYMAPEQIRGESVDGRADLYSCGAILYEMLSGTPPFQAEDVFGYVSKHLKEPVIPLGDRCPERGIPKEVDDLVMWMLEKNPLQRPKDAQQVIDVLGKYAGGTSSARMQFLVKVVTAFFLPGAAAAGAIWAMLPPSIPVLVTQAGAEGQEALSATLPFSLDLLRVHGACAALFLGIAGTAGVMWQPRTSVAAYMRRLILVTGLLAVGQGVALAIDGTLFAAASYFLTSFLVFVAFSLAWPMESRVHRFLWAGIAAPVAACLLNPVPLRLEKTAQGVAGDVTKEFFRRIWDPELWQGSATSTVGFWAVLTVLLTGLLVGVGAMFLPKPGRGSAA